MKLTSFKIQNFRSIIDSRWCNLAPDNITSLIGQNESGKTSILNALYSFYTGKIVENDLRTDRTLPQVSCSFKISPEEFAGLFESLNLPDGLLSAIEKKGRINLTRFWVHDKTSKLDLEEHDISDIFVKEADKAAKATECAEEATREEKEIAAILAAANKELDVANKAAVAAATAVASAAEAAKPAALAAEKVAKESVLVAKEKVTKAVEAHKVAGEKAEAATSAKKLMDDTITAEQFLKIIFRKIPVFELFEDFSGLLPDTIDIADLKNQENSLEGYVGAQNLIKVAGFDLEQIETDPSRFIANITEELNKKLTRGFQDFWRQKIGKTNKIGIQLELKNHPRGEKAGAPYIAFWVNDGIGKLYPKQRSRGVVWFLSFYLHLRASAIESEKRGRILLVDEPGGTLHANAQEDVLKLFEDIKDQIQIIYTTHSSHLVKLETLYRVLAVQRDDEDDEKSATQILDVHQFGAASTDSLSPIYTLMGADLSQQEFVEKTNNVLLEEISAYYYLTAFWMLCGSTKKASFIPATGASNIPLYANLLLGWGLSFIVVVDDDSAGRKVYGQLKHDLFEDDDAKASKRMYKIKNSTGIEDTFTNTDFKKYVLNDSSLTYTDPNSKYIKSKQKAVAAIQFMIKVKEGKLRIEDLDKTTQDEIRNLVNIIESLLD